MKNLKFAPLLRELILKWEKTTTWRINDDKDIRLWDKIDLLWWAWEEPFAKAQVTNVKITTFWKITFEDIEWHEKFDTHEEMLKTYSSYYNIEVTNETELKIIKFKILD